MKKWTYLFIFLSLALLFTSLWYTPKIESKEKEIPSTAIRLRILANSDQIQDQWVKRRVRDAIVHEMKSWVNQPNNIQEARNAIQSQLPFFQDLAEKKVRQAGYLYPVKVTLGKVPFPTKLYGGKVYPAGNYEALLVTLGEGEGANWWCVLFPPLCFVDMGSGEAIAKENEGILSASASKGQTYPSSESQYDSDLSVRFLFWDQISSIWEKVF